MTIETEDVVAFAEHLRRKAAATDDIGDATDFAQAADELQSLSERIAVLEGERNDIGYHAEQLATYIAQSSISEKHLASARFHNDKIRARTQNTPDSEKDG